MCAKPRLVRHVNITQSGDEEDEYAFTAADEVGNGKVMVTVGGIPVKTIIDSGTSVNVIDQTPWKALKKQKIQCVSRKNTKKLYSYGAT